MKIAVLAASGKQGRKLVEEAHNRDLDVTAFVRNENKQVDSIPNVVKDIFDLSYDDIKGFDVIIDAFGAWGDENVIQHQTSLKHLVHILKGKPNRLLIVGGAGSLYVDSNRRVRLIDTPDFPENAKSLAASMAKAFNLLSKHNDVNWTYVSPSMIFDADGKRTGEYQLGSDELLKDADGKSYISYADYAVAMIDEAENGNHIKERITVGSK